MCLPPALSRLLGIQFANPGGFSPGAGRYERERARARERVRERDKEQKERKRKRQSKEKREGGARDVTEKWRPGRGWRRHLPRAVSEREREREREKKSTQDML